ncbi:MAG: ATP-dependent protease [Gammaproteobacteria bacterium]|nr:MAG: ATP-dependent protease [Gammaproteobacteria bacterium]UTW42991.1 YifB family Mg chelatase-like AAA ATPase [bacterium SCSIO 12844]
MSLATVKSRAQSAMKAPLVFIEVHLSNGLPGLSIVGLPETAVKESKDRVRSAIINSGFSFPMRKITINMAPADLPKEGGRFDLPIALGILAASGQCNTEILEAYEFAGELALGGQLRAIRGVLPFALAAFNAGSRLIIPAANADDVSLVKDLTAYKANTLSEVIHHLETVEPLKKIRSRTQMPYYDTKIDLSDVKGQYQARRALEISASGRHNMLLMGPPGTGKTMLASRLNTILPPLTESEALESASIHSIHGAYKVAERFFIRPFRTPHHTASAVALVGGGSQPKPGEISLAHYGVLFLDEFPEYDRSVLEVLREPLESGKITISRANRNAEFPAKFQLVAAMNPCPCGYLGSQVKNCSCTESQVKRYQNKLSGPLLDRIDLHIEVPDLPKGLLSDQKSTYENSETIRARVNMTYDLQIERQGCTNSQLSGFEIDHFCRLAKAEAKLLDQAMERLSLSARAYHRILKVSRTIADIEKSSDIQISHITEALSYRKLDRYIQ